MGSGVGCNTQCLDSIQLAAGLVWYSWGVGWVLWFRIRVRVRNVIVLSQAWRHNVVKTLLNVVEVECSHRGAMKGHVVEVECRHGMGMPQAGQSMASHNKSVVRPTPCGCALVLPPPHAPLLIDPSSCLSPHATVC